MSRPAPTPETPADATPSDEPGGNDGTRDAPPASDPPADPSDVSLLRRTAAGERDAFGTLVARHHAGVYRFLAAMLRSPEDAADVTQEAFLNAYRHAADFRAEAAVRTWLFRIARHAALDKLRASRRRGELGRAGAGGDAGVADRRVDETSADPAAATETADRRRLVRDAIDALPDDQREVVLLRELEGLDYDAIAAALDIPVGTVRSRLHRGRETLRNKLAPHLRP